MKVLFIVILSMVALAKGAKVPPQKSHDKVSCSRLELDRQDCTLNLGPMHVDLHLNKWTLHDPKHLAVHDLPTGENTVIWNRGKLWQAGERYFLEFAAWSPPAGEPSLETLTWYVLEVQEGTPQIHVQETIQRRRRVVNSSADRTPAAAPKVPEEPKFQMDPLEKHGLKVEAKKLHWWKGSRHEEIE